MSESRDRPSPASARAAVADYLPLEVAELFVAYVRDQVNGSIELHFREGRVRAFKRVEHAKVGSG